jgi:beta-glucosidase
MKRSLFVVASVLLLSHCAPKKPAKNGALLDHRVDSVLALMTLDEKIGQLTLFTSDMDQTGAFIRKEYEEDIKQGKVGAIFNAYGAAYTRKLQDLAMKNTRLRIPLLFGYDVIHGHRTIFPVPLAEASSWNIAAMENTARIAAREAAAEGLHWTFAPMADVARDPRWGRIVEGSGEDPYLGSLIAAARVRGFQGTDLSDPYTVAACVKHFAAYGAAQAGRDYHTTDLSERALLETYLPPYKAALDAGAVTVMTSFNDLNGIPATANRWLFTDLLRKQWGFEGFVVTDYTAIMELIQHGIAGNPAEASALALNAGVDMSMQDGYFLQHLAQLVEEKKVRESDIDEAVRRILRVKFQLGLFDDPYRYSNEEREKTEIRTPEHLAAALDMAHKSMVLLKNDNHTLPFSKDVKTVALIGPLSEARRELMGSWSAAGHWEKSVTLLEGLTAELPGAKIIYAEGADFQSDKTGGFAAAIDAAKKADVVILALGETHWMSGEAASRSSIGLPGVQQQLAEAVLKVGKPTAIVLMNGRPLAIPTLVEKAPAILEAWFLGHQTGTAIADVLFGDVNPSGKLTVTFPRNEGQIPVFYNMRNTGRPFDPNSKYTTKYLDVPNEPLFVFGHGLSYTTFAYSDIVQDKTEISVHDSVKVTVTVTNTGNREGIETVQLYLKDHVGSATRPVRELKDFRQITLQPGEAKEVTFYVASRHMAFYRADMSWGTEPGQFTAFIGGDSQNTKAASFVLK